MTKNNTLQYIVPYFYKKIKFYFLLIFYQHIKKEQISQLALLKNVLITLTV